ncbi:MAG: hypothetical protein M3291_07355 [Actinomycetota bacterium]|nr:hypothetical protein [Actinomycetota bacterium]
MSSTAQVLISSTVRHLIEEFDTSPLVVHTALESEDSALLALWAARVLQDTAP